MHNRPLATSKRSSRQLNQHLERRTTTTPSFRYKEANQRCAKSEYAELHFANAIKVQTKMSVDLRTAYPSRYQRSTSFRRVRRVRGTSRIIFIPRKTHDRVERVGGRDGVNSRGTSAELTRSGHISRTCQRSRERARAHRSCIRAESWCSLGGERKKRREPRRAIIIKTRGGKRSAVTRAGRRRERGRAVVAGFVYIIAVITATSVRCI